MAISYPITLPAVGTNYVRFRQVSAVAVVPSPYNFVTQTQAYDGQKLMVELHWPPQKRATMEAIVTAFYSLNGREGTFYLTPPTGGTARGTATGTPLVNGTSQTGYDLVTDGWTNSITGIMKAGDWLQLGSGSSSRLHKVMADANSNGSGQATLTLWPKLRSSPADNAVITVSNPKGVFRLTTDGVDWDIDKFKIYGLSISAEEVV